MTDDLEKVNSSVATGEIQSDSKVIDIYNSITISNLSDFPVNDFFRVPFTHHSPYLEHNRLPISCKDISYS